MANELVVKTYIVVADDDCVRGENIVDEFFAEFVFRNAFVEGFLGSDSGDKEGFGRR